MFCFSVIDSFSRHKDKSANIKGPPSSSPQQEQHHTAQAQFQAGTQTSFSSIFIWNFIVSISSIARPILPVFSNTHCRENKISAQTNTDGVIVSELGGAFYWIGVFVYVINCRAEFVRCGSLMWHDPLGELFDTRQRMWRACCYIVCLDREKIRRCWLAGGCCEVAPGACVDVSSLLL
jgi:hypothetical protein